MLDEQTQFWIVLDKQDAGHTRTKLNCVRRRTMSLSPAFPAAAEILAARDHRPLFYVSAKDYEWRPSVD
jgi:hypothetical protein